MKFMKLIPLKRQVSKGHNNVYRSSFFLFYLSLGFSVFFLISCAGNSSGSSTPDTSPSSTPDTNPSVAADEECPIQNGVGKKERSENGGKVCKIQQCNRGYTLDNGQCQPNPSSGERWDNPELIIDYKLDTCPADLNMESFFEQAIEIWNNAVAGVSILRIRKGQSLNVTPSEVYSGHIAKPLASPHVAVIICDDQFDLGSKSIAVELTSLRNERILNSAIILNTNPNISGSFGDSAYHHSDVEILKVLAHEIGHMIGLEHYTEALDSVMISGTSTHFNGLGRVVLSTGDVNEVARRYPD